MPDKKIMAGGAVLFGAAFWFYIKPHYVDPKPVPPPPTAEEIAAAPRPTVYLGRTPGEKGKPPTDTGLVFNLKAPATAPAYAKVIIALEFEDPKHTYLGLKGAALDAKNLAFTEELQSEMYRVMDAVTRVFGSKSTEDLASIDGKEKLKTDLVAAINKELHEQRVAAVYFVTLITQ